MPGSLYSPASTASAEFFDAEDQNIEDDHLQSRGQSQRVSNLDLSQTRRVGEGGSTLGETYRLDDDGSTLDQTYRIGETGRDLIRTHRVRDVEDQNVDAEMQSRSRADDQPHILSHTTFPRQSSLDVGFTWAQTRRIGYHEDEIDDAIPQATSPVGSSGEHTLLRGAPSNDDADSQFEDPNGPHDEDEEQGQDEDEDRELDEDEEEADEADEEADERGSGRRRGVGRGDG